MKDSELTRALLLEQLESRCLLAGGVFSHSAEHHQDRHRDAALGHSQWLGQNLGRENQSQESRSHFGHQDNHVARRNVQPFERSQSIERSQQLDGRRGRNLDNSILVTEIMPTTVIRLEPLVVDAFASRTQAPLVLVPEVTTLIILLEMPGQRVPSRSDSVPSVLSAANTLTSASLPTGSEIASRSGQVGEKMPQAAASSDGSAILPEGASRQSIKNPAASVSAGAVSSANASDAKNMAEEQRLTESESRAAINQSTQNLYSESLGANASTGDRSSVGMIETMPLLRRELRSNASDSADDSADGDWQIESQSLRRLREIARNASPSLADPESEAMESSLPSRHMRPQITDAAITSWFGEQTGLIELKSNESIPTGLTLEDSIVDVVLNATVGLHRSVELIAGIRIDSDRTDLEINETRDAVLAAIAGEQSSPFAVPVSDATTGQFSSLVYPGAAIVATGISIVAQRRRQQPKLESSR